MTFVSNFFSFSLADDSIILNFTRVPVGLFQLEAKFTGTYGNTRKFTSFNYLTLPTATSSSHKKDLCRVRAKHLQIDIKRT